MKKVGLCIHQPLGTHVLQRKHGWQWTVLKRGGNLSRHRHRVFQCFWNVHAQLFFKALPRGSWKGATFLEPFLDARRIHMSNGQTFHSGTSMSIVHGETRRRDIDSAPFLPPSLAGILGFFFAKGSTCGELHVTNVWLTPATLWFQPAVLDSLHQLLSPCHGSLHHFQQFLKARCGFKMLLEHFKNWCPLVFSQQRQCCTLEHRFSMCRIPFHLPFHMQLHGSYKSSQVLRHCAIQIRPRGLKVFQQV